MAQHSDLFSFSNIVTMTLVGFSLSTVIVLLCCFRERIFLNSNTRIAEPLRSSFLGPLPVSSDAVPTATAVDFPVSGNCPAAVIGRPLGCPGDNEAVIGRLLGHPGDEVGLCGRVTARIRRSFWVDPITVTPGVVSSQSNPPGVIFV